MTVVCNDEGSFAASVAWGARRAGVTYRTLGRDAIEALVHCQGLTDHARHAIADATRQGWLVVCDASWPGYTEVPRMVMQGYRLVVDEAVDQLQGPPPTHVFVQAGTGSFAAAVSAHIRARLGIGVRLVVVGAEPEPNLLAWQELERAAFAYVDVGDAASADAVSRLAAEGITTTAPGAAGAAGLLGAASDASARAALELGRESRVLLFNTDGSGA